MPALKPLALGREVAAAIGSRGPSPGDRVLLASRLCREPSVVFYLRRDAGITGEILEARPDEAAALLRAGGPRTWVAASPEDLEAIAAGSGRPLEALGRVRGANISKGEVAEIVVARTDG
jgi:hypothetical protein